jgi:hypothetical protein
LRHRHLGISRTRLERAAQAFDVATQTGETAIVIMRAHAIGPNQRSELFAQLLEPLAKNACFASVDGVVL